VSAAEGVMLAVSVALVAYLVYALLRGENL
jgi:K+-transporting ATPase KdpF subunit